MPKSYGNLWSQIVSFENLLRGYNEARKGKRYQFEVLRFSDCLEENIFRIQDDLIAGRWRPSPFREFIKVDTLKRRLIQAPAFCDRVVHHALVGITQPFMERKWIYDSYACRRGKGVHRCVSRTKDFLYRAWRMWEHVYVLQADISKYFQSINHKILLNILQRTFREKEVLSLYQTIIETNNTTGQGIPIGALTSQTLANHYLSEVDHFVKEKLRVKFYIRYMDDMIILGSSKEYLKDILVELKLFIETKLELHLNPKTHIYPACQGVDFTGYRIWKTHILPRKRNVKAAKKRFKSISKRYAKGEVDLEYAKSRVVSFIGYMQHCNGYHSTVSALKYLILRRNSYESNKVSCTK